MRRIRFVKETVRLWGSETATVCVRGSPAAGKYDGAICESSRGNRKAGTLRGAGLSNSGSFFGRKHFADTIDGA